MNGQAVKKPTSSPVWDTVSKWLAVTNPDMEYWWKLTGPHISHMMQAAGYTSDAQYNALLFHYQWIVPNLGPAPINGSRPQWKSLLGNEGSPIEYSWEWNKAAGRPEVRSRIEVIGPYAGRPLDPLNQVGSLELLHRLQEAVPTVDLTYTNHFLATLFDHDRGKYAQEAANGVRFTSTVFLAPEWPWRGSGFNIKTYFLPRMVGGTVNAKGLTLTQWEDSLKQIDPTNEARQAMFDFLANDPEGQYLVPYMLAVDNVKPSRSCLRLYFIASHSSFASVRRIMSLGGKVQVPEPHLQELRTLICAVSGLDPNFPEYQETPFITNSHYNTATKDNFRDLPEILHSYIYSFDIAPGKTVPDVEFYTPVRGYGPDDCSLAANLINWMEERGRGKYAEEYLGMLEHLSQDGRLKYGKGAQTYISALIKHDGELDVTSYLGPTVADTSQGVPRRRRGMHRRSDSR